MIVLIFLLCGCIQHVQTINCYTCDQPGGFCILPFNIDGGQENNEDDINSYSYGPNFVCLSDQYIDPQTGQETVIVKGVEQCEEIDIPNHRRHCCTSDNCNKVLPPIRIESAIQSNDHRSLPSIILLLMTMIFQYIY